MQKVQIFLTRFASRRVFPLLHRAFDTLLPSPVAKQVQAPSHQLVYPLPAQLSLFAHSFSRTPAMGLLAHDGNGVVYSAHCRRHDMRHGHPQARGRVLRHPHE